MRGLVVERDAVCAGPVLAGTGAGIVAAGREYEPDVLRLSDGDSLGPTLVSAMRTKTKLWGAVCIARAPGERRFTQAELDSASDFVSRASISLELALARENAQRAMLADDRSRIARDLHDHVIQQLFGTGLTIQSVLGSLPSGTEAARLGEAVDQLDDAISQIRTVVFALSRRETSTIRHEIIDVIAEISGSTVRPAAIRFTGPVDHSIVGDLSTEVVGGGA